MVKKSNKGWKGEPARHSLAARGIKTKNSKTPIHPMSVEYKHIPKNRNITYKKNITYDSTLRDMNLNTLHEWAIDAEKDYALNKINYTQYKWIINEINNTATQLEESNDFIQINQMEQLRSNIELVREK